MFSKYHFLLSQLRGYKTKEKLVIIESDDWGTERIPSLKTREKLNKLGLDMDSNPHSRVDTLEQEDDLIALYEVFDEIIKQFPDKKPMITCNFVMGNPDYEKIKKERYQKYHYELFTETYRKKYGNDNTWLVIKEGIKKGYIYPQFHARDHLNIFNWLSLLRANDKDYLTAFDNNTYAVNSRNLNNIESIMAAYDYSNEIEKNLILESIREGIKLFKEGFGMNSFSTVPPRYVWDNDIEKEFAKNNIDVFQSALNQILPSFYNYHKVKHYTGERSKNNILYSVRNAHFEPAYNSNINWVGQVLEKAKIAFFLKTPLIISTHRLNYVGSLIEVNRNKNLNLLSFLIKSLIKIYPQVRFITSVEFLQILTRK